MPTNRPAGKPRSRHGTHRPTANRIYRWHKARGAQRVCAALTDLPNLEADQIAERLPAYLGLDLQTHRADHPEQAAPILFLDTYEALWSDRPDKTGLAAGETDARVRALIAAMRDGLRGPGQGVPILTHTYDFPTPRNAPARFLFRPLGPWLFTALQTSQVPTVHWLPITDHLFTTLADALLALAKGANAIPNFHVVDTRNTLQRPDLGVTGRTTDWLNEIHPSDDGYEKLARRIEPVLEPLIGTV